VTEEKIREELMPFTDAHPFVSDNKTTFIESIRSNR
jgi:hypothetical protein